MRIAAISAYVPRYDQRSGPVAQQRETVTVRPALPIEATPAQISRLLGRGAIVDVVC